MRAAILVCLIFALQSHAAERTWTIARDVYHADGELVAVRGDLVYLKIDGRVEEVPIERLSALDQQYINTLSFAPILPGPAADAAGPMVSPAIAQQDAVQEEMPLPGPPDPPRGEQLELNAPDLAPAYGGTPIRSQSAPQPQPRTRFDRYGRIVPPQPGTPANYVAPWGEPRTGANANDRYKRRAPQQDRNDQNARSRRDDDDDDDDGPGLFGFRARRLERERATANHSR